ncbi:MAG: hypothetical protein K5744_12015 [Eubacterium sp.]|nr:hypothetical protein [Eubacterium sp.]
MEDEKKEITEQGKAPEKDSTEVKKTARKKSTKKASDEQTAEKKPAAKRKSTKKKTEETGAEKLTAAAEEGATTEATPETATPETATPETATSEAAPSDNPAADNAVAELAADQAEQILVDPSQMPTTPAEMKKTRKRASSKTKAAKAAEKDQAKASEDAKSPAEDSTVDVGAQEASAEEMMTEDAGAVATETVRVEENAAAANGADDSSADGAKSGDSATAASVEVNEGAEAQEAGKVEKNTAEAALQAMQTQVLPNAAALRTDAGAAKKPAVKTEPADVSASTGQWEDRAASVQEVIADAEKDEPAGDAQSRNSYRSEEKAAQYVIKPDEFGRNTYDNSKQRKDKKPAKKENPFLEWLSDNLRYIELGAVLVIAIVVIVFGILMIRRNSTENTGNTGKLTPVPTKQAEKVISASSTEPTVTVTAAPTGIVLPADTLTEQTEGPIYEAVQSYFASLDTSGAVNGIVAYSDIQVYAYPGSSKDSYLAFAKYNYKYSDYNANVPALTELFIRVQPNGSMKIETEVSDAESAYMNAAVQSPAAQSMISDLQTQYDQVMAANTDLADYIATQQ